MFRALVAVTALAVATPAHAANVYMWGVGPRIGTHFLPGAYPSAFPKYVQDDVVDGTDTPVIDKARADFLFGLEAHYYINGVSRIGMNAGFDVGKRFFDAHALLKYNYVLMASSVDFLIGAGAGFGTARWKGEGDRNAKLRVPYFPLRVEAAAQVRADFLAFQLTPFFQYNLPANHFYTDDTGLDIDLKEQDGRKFGLYPTVGIEFSVLFGDYEPPKPRKRR